MSDIDLFLRITLAVGVTAATARLLGRDNSVVPKAASVRLDDLQTGDLVLISFPFSVFAGMLQSPFTHVGIAVRTPDGVRMFHCNARNGSHISPFPAKLAFVRRLHPTHTIPEHEAYARIKTLVGRAYSATYSPIIGPMLCPWFPLPLEPYLEENNGLTCIGAVMLALETLGIRDREEADASLTFDDLSLGALGLKSGLVFGLMQQVM